MEFCILNYLCFIKHLIVISGPTASGKTSLSVELAKELNTVILSADSRQFYREISIGTAKPTKVEMDGVPHFFIDSHNLKDEVTAADFEREGLRKLEELFSEHDFVVLVGGSGMFIDALCLGLDDIPTSMEVRKELMDLHENSGLGPLLDELREKDPDYFEQVDRQNPARVIRAVEVIRITGKPYSVQRKASPKERPFQIHRFVIQHDRALLYERINRRVDIMIEEGLIEEAKSVHHLHHLTSLRTVGYQELFAYFDGHYPLETAIEKIKQNSRRYAKRQTTWFKRHPESVWIDYKENNLMIKEIKDYLKQKQILE